MPVTKSRNGMHEMLALDPSNTTRFLFGDDEEQSSSDMKSYLQMNATDDNFPILVRRDENPRRVSVMRLDKPTLADRYLQLSASSAALDLASPQATGSDSNGWSAFARHRPAQQSLPVNTVHQMNGQNGSSNGSSSTVESPISVRPSYRHSLDLKYYGEGQQEQTQVTSPTKHIPATPPKLQSSYSANDIPTMKTNGTGSVNTTPNSHAQQHFHNHNASLGRIPPNAINNRQSRDLSAESPTTLREAQNGSYQTIQSALQANAPPFGPPISQGTSQPQSPAAMASPTMSAYSAVPGYYNNYNMQMMTMGMQNIQIGQPQGYPPQNPYANYGNMYPQNGARDSQSRVIQQRRQTDGEGEFPLSKRTTPGTNLNSHESLCQP